ncbi:MAG: anti-sigma factor [Gemmatimonadaceae bacterium]|nr:anti-sigma factor [Gemmatimonadaceae bacterium]
MTGDEMEDETLAELLMQRATGALSGPEADALAAALARLPRGEAARWEAAAAELTAAMVAADPAAAGGMPPALLARVVETGEALVRVQPRTSVRAAPFPRRPGLLAWSGWFAAAAALVLWFALPRGSATPAPVVVVVTAAERATRLRDTLLTRDPAVQRMAFAATKDASARGAGGDVVWSGAAQRGVMRITGLQPNDRTRWQYQLWIFDRARDEKYPVDGGVFDIPAGAGEVLVPIDTRVPVGDAVMFAVTVEKAGGVVVSTRERIALLANRGG